MRSDVARCKKRLPKRQHEDVKGMKDMKDFNMKGLVTGVSHEGFQIQTLHAFMSFMSSC
jgi:hypothetical protein